MKALTAKIGIVLLVAVMVATGYAATVEQVVVRQLWPWSTDVRVEYNVTGVTTPVDVSVTAFNGNEQLSAPGLESAIVGDVYGISRSGVYSFTIDPVKAFGTDQIAMSEFKVHLSLSDSAANINEVLYKIYDLTSGSCTDVTRADLLGHKYGSIETNYTAFTGFNTPVSDVLIWTGITNDAKYATTHLVMRKIPAKNQTFKMGSPSSSVGRGADEEQHDVTLTNDFYMGVFEVTQYQYWKFTGSWPSFYSLEECRDTRPVDKGVRWDVMRGGSWPDDLSHGVSSEGFLGHLRAALDGTPKIDLPTEAQWEYACRAKSTTDWYTGYNCESDQLKDSPDHLRKIARFRMSGGYGPNGSIIGDANYAATLGTSNGTARVGSYLPNAWGLYDMTGNVWEWCLDRYDNFSSDEQTEPPGPAISPTSTRTLRGGGITSPAYDTRTAKRLSKASSWSGGDGVGGFRLCLTVTE